MLLITTNNGDSKVHTAMHPAMRVFSLVYAMFVVFTLTLCTVASETHEHEGMPMDWLATYPYPAGGSDNIGRSPHSRSNPMDDRSRSEDNMEDYLINTPNGHFDDDRDYSLDDDVRDNFTYTLPGSNSTTSSVQILYGTANDSDAQGTSGGKTDFNITAAAASGVRAQYSVCNTFCSTDQPSMVVRSGCPPDNLECESCFCDGACPLYGDCCPSRDQDSFLDIGDKAYVCEEVSVGHYKVSVQAIASCLELAGWEPDAAEACLHCRYNRSVRQLAVSLVTHAIYCNIHCAVCNGDTNVTVMTSDPEYDETLDTDLTSDTEFLAEMYDLSRSSGESDQPQTDQTPVSVNGSSSTSKSPGTPYLAVEHRPFMRTHLCTARRTPLPVVSTCNATLASELREYDSVEALCDLYSYPVTATGRGTGAGAVYRNLFCALCNGIVPGTCDTLAVSKDDVRFHMETLTSLSTQPEKDTKTCADKEKWFDPVLRVCRPMLCDIDRRLSLEDGFCRHPVVNDMSTHYLYSIRIALTPRNNDTRLQCLPHVKNDVGYILADAVGRLNVTTYAIASRCALRSPSSSGVDAVVEIIVAGSSRDQIHFEMEMVKEFSAISELTLGEPGGGNRTVFDAQVEMVDGDFDGNLTVFHEWLISFRNGSCCHAVVGEVSLFLHYLIVSGDVDMFDSFHFVMFDPVAPYALVFLNTSEFTRVAHADIYQLTYANVSLDGRKVRKEYQGLLVPVEVLRQAYARASPDPNPAEHIGAYQLLSVCCLVVSVLSLILLLVTYSTFSELRTLPGINTMFLAGWLLLAQVLLLVVPHRTDLAELCGALGVALHYAWLCVVSWSSVCSFHMFHVFVGQRQRARVPHRHSWYLRRYVAVSHASPALVVAAVLGGSAAGSGGADTGYGGTVCYLNTALLVGLGFVLPLALSVLLNVLLLALTARAVARVERLQNHGGHAERSNVRVYAGLSSLTGMCWALALVAEVPGCGWLRYVSTVLNGLQGLHLALCYTASGRVVRLWRHLLFTGRTVRRGGKRSVTTTSSSPAHTSQLSARPPV